MPAKKSDIPEEVLKRFQVLANVIGMEIKGASLPYLSLNGHMFAFLAADDSLNIRLPEATRQEVIRMHKARLAEQHGAVLKEYVVIPEKLLKDKKQMAQLIKASHEYVSTLKPKATKKK
jgi:hypothetical protein